MLNRTQIIMTVSVALASFLIGTIFQPNFIAVSSSGTDDYGVPFDKIWEAIYDLQQKVGVDGRTETMRFFEATETFADEVAVYKDAASFVWTPNNSTNNAIISIRFYFEYKVETVGSLKYRIQILCGDPPAKSWNYDEEYTAPSSYKWTNVRHLESQTFSIGWVPNQPIYTIEFLITSTQNPAYIRNINLILVVADGLPAES